MTKREFSLKEIEEIRLQLQTHSDQCRRIIERGLSKDEAMLGYPVGHQLIIDVDDIIEMSIWRMTELANQIENK